jgi:hypothetical protein
MLMSADKNVEKLKLSHAAGGNIKCHSQLGTSGSRL